MKKKIGIVVAAFVLVVLVCVGFYFVKIRLRSRAL